jgi:hypothetical protein
MSDAEIERRAAHIELALMRGVVAEIVPQAERHRRQLQPSLADTIVFHFVVAIFGGLPGHDVSLQIVIFIGAV